jgi:hypothetical protein
LVGWGVKLPTHPILEKRRISGVFKLKLSEFIAAGRIQRKATGAR